MNDRAKQRIRLIGVVVGLALMVAAVVLVVQRHEQVVAAFEAIKRPSPLLLMALPLCVLGNLLLTGAMFHQLMSRYGRVGHGEMQALIAASALANYLPLRPGLFGRVAYHAVVNRIPPSRSVRTIAQAILLTACAALALMTIVLLAPLIASHAVWIMLPAPAMLLLIVSAAWRAPGVRPWCFAAMARYLDMLLWVARYALAFALVGAHVPVASAAACACVGTLATMIPFSSNGLGLREWAIGMMAAQLMAITLELGITAELVNRAAEVGVILLAGLAGWAWLARRGASVRDTEITLREE